MFRKIKSNIIDIYKVWRQELTNARKDVGVLLFFLFLPLAYPIVYSLIYNPEVVRDVPVVVVDDGRTDVSREFVRMLDATSGAKVVGYAADLAEAKRAMNEKECYAVLHLPGDFTKNIGNKKDAHVDLYCEMSLLFRYRELLVSITATGLQMDNNIQLATINNLAPGMSSISDPMPSFTFSLGNTEQGIASFLLPGILILILQQSIVLSVMMLGAGGRERARKNGGVDPRAVGNSALNILIGKALCYFTLYIVPTAYLIHFVPYMFNFPQFGDFWQVVLFAVPLVLASVFFGMTLQPMAREREDTFVLYVFTSVMLLFLSGLTWPRYAMSAVWKAISSVIPATWGLQGFIQINGNAAILSEVSTQYYMLWFLAAIYCVISYIMIRYVDYGTSGYLKMRRMQLRKSRI